MNQPEGCVEVFAEIACPFTHVGLQRLLAERTRRGLSQPRFLVRAWPLELVNGRPLDVDHVDEEVVALRDQISPDLFAGFDPQQFPETSIPAFGLAAAAYQRSTAAGEGVSLALRRALFEERRDITDHETLWKIGAPFSVQPMSTRAAEMLAETDWQEGRRRGVEGSPQFFVGDRTWFCPSLTINHDGGHFTIRRDDVALGEFYAAIFGAAIAP